MSSSLFSPVAGLTPAVMGTGTRKQLGHLSAQVIQQACSQWSASLPHGSIRERSLRRLFDRDRDPGQGSRSAVARQIIRKVGEAKATLAETLAAQDVS